MVLSRHQLFTTQQSFMKIAGQALRASGVPLPQPPAAAGTDNALVINACKTGKYPA
jgi:hypothetical protein